MREQTEKNARTRSRDERVKFREGAASLFWRPSRGEARVPSSTAQRRAALRRPGCCRDFVFAILVLHGLRQRKGPYREPSQRMSPQKPGSGGLQVACFGP